MDERPSERRRKRETESCAGCTRIHWFIREGNSDERTKRDPKQEVEALVQCLLSPSADHHASSGLLLASPVDPILIPDDAEASVGVILECLDAIAFLSSAGDAAMVVTVLSAGLLEAIPVVGVVG